MILMLGTGRGPAALPGVFRTKYFFAPEAEPRSGRAAEETKRAANRQNRRKGGLRPRRPGLRDLRESRARVRRNGGPSGITSKGER